MTFPGMRATSPVILAASLTLAVGCSDASEIKSAIESGILLDKEADALTKEQVELQKSLDGLQIQMDAAKLRHASLQGQIDENAALRDRLESSIGGADDFEAEEGKR
jgi:Tfp pilus assembly protein PilN